MFNKILRKLGLKSFSSKSYWEERYQAGGNSGNGSYNELADFKAKVINDFVEKHNINTVVEYGCGDGNQLLLSNYKNYIGFDVSAKAVEICREKFLGDSSKKFLLVDEYSGQKADLTLSLDVIYHLIEDGVFNNYMQRLFDSSNNFVIIYSSNKEENPEVGHVKHRLFTKWVSDNVGFELVEKIDNIHPYESGGSFADFYIFKKMK
ncbi:class I SAM-dependent methyltransferase [Vibrio sp. M260112]|uniref:class I SAM-dependent methyltransferase n=1 Tax=Vibrio sp. M260112 TaxID=3020895 RepID=UPI002F4042A2